MLISLHLYRYLKEGTVLKNYAHVLVMLLRLRQGSARP